MRRREPRQLIDQRDRGAVPDQRDRGAVLDLLLDGVPGSGDVAEHDGD